MTFCFCAKSPAIWPIHLPDFTTCTHKCYSRSKNLFWCSGRRSTFHWKCECFIRGVVTCKSVSHVPRNNHGFQLLSHVPSHTHNSPTHFQWNSMSSNIRFSQMLWKPNIFGEGVFWSSNHPLACWYEVIAKLMVFERNNFWLDFLFWGCFRRCIRNGTYLLTYLLTYLPTYLPT